MDILIHSDGLTLTDVFRTAVGDKIGRVEQYAPRALRARVHVRKLSARPSPRQYEVRVHCELPGKDLTAAERGADALSALDAVAEKLERRLRKRKTERLAKRERKNPRARLKS